MKRAIRLELLEARALPATFGNLSLVTVSFAPDGTRLGQPVTQADGTIQQAPASNLFTKFASVPNWQTEIVRGIQTWASQFNANVVVVPDDGSPFGTAGAIQGDSRFGDIRVGTAVLSDEIAESGKFGGEAGTWAGDMLLGSGTAFNVGGTGGAVDLYSAALTQAGVIFGLDTQETDPTSATYIYYSSPHAASLSAGDVTAVQGANGGVRVHDAFDLAASNDTAATATALTGASPRVTADLTTGSDADHYSYTVPGGETGFTVRLRTTNVSVLTSKVEVLDATGTVVATGTAASPTDGSVTLTVTGTGTYTIRVIGAAADVFAVGAYQLAVDPLSAGTPALTPPAIVPQASPASDLGSVAWSTSLEETNRVDFFTLEVAHTGLTALTFDVSYAVPSSTPAAVEFILYSESTGQFLLRQVVNVGTAVTVRLLLQPGEYTYQMCAAPAAANAALEKVDVKIKDKPIEGFEKLIPPPGTHPNPKPAKRNYKPKDTLPKPPMDKPIDPYGREIPLGLINPKWRPAWDKPLPPGSGNQ